MKIDNLDKMIGGWFIGNFEPSLFKTNDCEVAVKRYNKGDYEGHHYHKIALMPLSLSSQIKHSSGCNCSCFIAV